MRSLDGTLDTIRTSPVSHHRDIVADVRLGHPGFEALDVANVNTPHHGTIFWHNIHRGCNILRTEDTV